MFLASRWIKSNIEQVELSKDRAQEDSWPMPLEAFRFCAIHLPRDGN